MERRIELADGAPRAIIRRPATAKPLMSNESPEKSQRIDRIRAIVNEDYERVTSTDDPYVILNLPNNATWEEATARYERYERFYRAENFQRLGDVDLTRKALDIRRVVGRAIIDIQGVMESNSIDSEAMDGVSNTGVLALDPNASALADIYFRDGLTFLKLGDLDNALECFRTGSDYDPTRGSILAYRAYTAFRKTPLDPTVAEESRKNLYQATRMDPANADIWVLVARYHIKQKDGDEAESAIAKVRTLDPKHPKLGKLLRNATSF